MVDSAAHRLYLSHGMQTEVLDTRTEMWLGRVAQTPGVRGIALAPELNRGYTSNASADSVTVFDLTTLDTVSTVTVGGRPDAIVYDPKSQRLVVFNNRSQDIGVIDAVRNELIASVPAGGEPESAAVAADGTVYFNVEDTNELAVFDPVALRVRARHRLYPCQRPTGLAIDAAGRVASVCRNQWLVVSGADGQSLGSARIGAGSDAVVWLNGAAYSADGLDGRLSVVAPASGGGFVALAGVPTALGSRTLAADAATRLLYVPAASFEPAKDGGRPKGVAGSLRLLVFATP